MSRLGSWLRGPPKALPTGNGSISAYNEPKLLQHALSAAILIMNDDVEGADAELAKGDSSFHKLGTGVTFFLRSVLGFEQETMKEAALRLSEAENKAWADMKRAQKDLSEDKVFHSKIYPIGSEFALCYALTQLMSAVVAVLNESLTESLKGFYKLRKAYITLDAIVEAERKYFQQLQASSKTSLPLKSKVQIPGGWGADETDSGISTRNVSTAKLGDTTNSASVNHAAEEDSDSDLEFVDAEEGQEDADTENYLGHYRSRDEMDEKMNDMSLGAPTSQTSQPILDANSIAAHVTDPVDVFVRSGSALCYGLLQLILSMIPPAFSRLLYIVGFSGDRERGLSLLWQSTMYDNIAGAVGGLVLLGYYNGLVGFCDVLLLEKDAPGENLTGYPKAKTEELLKTMRARYPESQLWLLEEARMKSGNRNLRAALEILSHNSTSKMKQVVALSMFEKSLTSMYLHEYAICSQSFQTCTELNNWSHALYYFCAGVAQVELYRGHRLSDPAAADKHRKLATELLKKAPQHAGKRRLLAKQLPFDVYVLRKLQKWEERARAWKCDLLDAIGVSPIEEMIYLWNGTKRMGPAELDTCLTKVSFDRATFPDKHAGNLDEVAIQAVIQSTVYRHQARYDEARQVLQEKILVHDRSAFKGHLRDDWSAPCAHYEMAVIAWCEKDVPGADTKAKIAECEAALQVVAKWEGYVLDSRIGLKISTATDTLKMYTKHKLANVP